MTNANIVKRWMEGGPSAEAPAFMYHGGEILYTRREVPVAVKFNGFYVIDPTDWQDNFSTAAASLHVWPEKCVKLPIDLLQRIIGSLRSNGDNLGGLKLVDQFVVDWRNDYRTQVFSPSTYSLLEHYGQYYLTAQSDENKSGTSTWLTKFSTNTFRGPTSYYKAENALWALAPKECYYTVNDLPWDERTKFYEYKENKAMNVWNRDTVIGFKRGVLRQGDLYFVPVRDKVNVSTKIPCNDSDVFMRYLECWPKCEDSGGTPFRVTSQYVDCANSMEYISNRVHGKTGSDRGRGKSRHTSTDIGMLIQSLYYGSAPSPVIERGTLVVRGIVRHPEHDNLKLEVVNKEHSDNGGWFTAHPVVNEEWSLSQNHRVGRPKGD